MPERLPPHSLDTEAAVLSALLLHPDAIAEVEPVVSPADFYASANRTIAETIWALDAAGDPVDVSTVAHRLHVHGKLDAVGGAPYLGQIIDATPAVAHVEAHARIVADLAAVRRVQAACATVRAGGFGDLADVPTWLASAERQLGEALDRREVAETQATVSEAAAAEYTELSKRDAPRDIVGLPTGIPGLDRTLRGLQDGNLYIDAARPGVGKTALAGQIALHVAPRLAREGRAVFFASLEMPRGQLMQRLLTQQSGVSHDAVVTRRIAGSDWGPLANAVEQIGAMPIVLDDRSGIGPHQLRSAVRRGMRRLPGNPRPGLVIVDYLQLMATPGGRGRNQTREDEVAGFSRALATMAKEWSCPVLALSQLNRDSTKTGRRPQLSDLRESGAIEQDAYAVLFLHALDDGGARELIVAKHRNGDTGIVRARYMGEVLRLREEEREPEPDHAGGIGWDGYEDHSEERYG